MGENEADNDYVIRGNTQRRIKSMVCTILTFLTSKIEITVKHVYSCQGQNTKKVVYTHVPLNIEGRRQVKEKHELKEGGAH